MARRQREQADIEGMKASLLRLENVLGRTRQVTTSMRDQANTLGADWTGAAAGDFNAALNAWLDDCATVERQLEIVTERLRKSTGEHARALTGTGDGAGGPTEGKRTG
ncbi:hypothetical protein [Streptomyces sp. SID12488]|uniref:WXG100 family type VII secretion target n=1 Tax=Streptomyces sp. SID12488 TaxID=2706040 RepID=UPI0013DC4B30|nr:hypothetical protein [Streptomyces sp. SID12488]NEA68421.1 hypothetical protein [Streptomyces sp. SID12488]